MVKKGEKRLRKLPAGAVPGRATAIISVKMLRSLRERVEHILDLEETPVLRIEMVVEGGYVESAIITQIVREKD